MTAHIQPFDAIARVLQQYFDGLHHSDTQRLRRVLHPQAIYATAAGEAPIIWRMEEYWPVVDARPSPASRGQARSDRILSIEFVGPVTALAKVQCSIGPKHFTDLLTLILVDGRWQVIAKVFHVDVATTAPAIP
jgi:hypothetical protein